MELKELFDYHVPVRTIANGMYRFTLLSKEGKQERYQIDIDDFDDYILIEFSSLTNDDNYGITGTGNAPFVFSAVKDTLEFYLEENNLLDKDGSLLTQIRFGAKEPSRIKLYTVFANALAKKYNAEVSTYVNSDDDVLEFIITPKYGSEVQLENLLKTYKKY